MKSLIGSLIILAGTVLPPTASAQDADDLKSAVLDFYEATNNEDPRYLSFFPPESDQFPRTGSLLMPNPTATPEGLDFEVEVRHLDATVYGDSAVATFYTVGTTTYPDGVILRGIYRASILAIRQENQWKFAHLHFSELVNEP